MLKVTSYPAILESTEDGYSAFFPDLPGAVSAGESYEAAVENPKECLSLHIYGMQRDGDPIPNPSKVAEIMRLAEPGDYVALIEPDIFSVKAHQEDKSVRINIAFPKSLLEASTSETARHRSIKTVAASSKGGAVGGGLDTILPCPGTCSSANF